jgi:hypothetical protein
MADEEHDGGLETAAMLSTPADRWSDGLLAGDDAGGRAAELLDHCGQD